MACFHTWRPCQEEERQRLQRSTLPDGTLISTVINDVTRKMTADQIAREKVR